MKKDTLLTGSTLFLFFFLSIAYPSKAQNISGVINSYAAVTAISGPVLSVSSSAGFTVGDKVMVIQMKGAGIDQTNTVNYGTILSYGNAGNYEFGFIIALTGTSITLQFPLCRTYDIPGKVQIITVPQYNNATITATLTCQAWNGSSGGVLIFEDQGTTTFNANIDVNSKGFRTGATCIGGFGCSNFNWFLSNLSCSGGKKGEGIADFILNQEGGRGKLSNGGGGGNPGNSGGGGGGNFGAGGLGGFEYSGCGNTGIQGIGGSALTLVNNKIFLGGGGGVGFNDNSQPIFSGTNGGAIVYINANAVNGNNFSILDNGLDQTNVTNDESAGGGGSGGTVCLNVPNYNSTLNVVCNGGAGGPTFNLIFTFDCHGPGGGGGGGVLWLSQASMPANLNFTANGGAPGLVTNPSSSCYNTPDGASAGQPGGVLFNFPSFAPLIPVSLGNDTLVCLSANFTLNAGSNYTTYLWQDNSTDSTFQVSSTGTYWVTVSNSFGCTDVDSVVVSLLPPIALSIGNDTTVCPGEIVNLQAPAGFLSYLWQNGSNANNFSATGSGIYYVTVTNAAGCSGSDTLVVNNFSNPIVSLGNDQAVCPGNTVTFDAGIFNSYLWQNGSINQTFTANTPANYWVTVTDNNGCMGSDTAAMLNFYPVPPTNLVQDGVTCPGLPVILFAEPGYASYLWPDGTGGNAFITTEPGSYSVTITNQFGCSSVSQANVGIFCPADIFFPNAFSPNGDGMNDIFRPYSYNITKYSILIYNRWGQLIYEGEDISKGWDGTFNGIPCEIGTYVFYSSYTGTSDGISTSGSKKGNVTLIR